MNSSVAVAAPNQIAPQRALVVTEPAAHERREQGRGRHRREASASGGPSSQASGGESTL